VAGGGINPRAAPFRGIKWDNDLLRVFLGNPRPVVRYSDPYQFLQVVHRKKSIDFDDGICYNKQLIVFFHGIFIPSRFSKKNKGIFSNKGVGQEGAFMAKNCYQCGKQLGFSNTFVYEKKPICKECLDNTLGKARTVSAPSERTGSTGNAGTGSVKTPPAPAMSDVRVPLSLESAAPYTFGKHVGQVWGGMVAKWGLLALLWLMFQVSKNRKNQLLAVVVGFGVLIVLSIVYALIGALFTYSSAKTRKKKVTCQNCKNSLIVDLDVLKKNVGDLKKGIFPCPTCKAGLNTN
jgi:hypothetical protein